MGPATFVVLCFVFSQFNTQSCSVSQVAYINGIRDSDFPCGLLCGVCAVFVSRADYKYNRFLHSRHCCTMPLPVPNYVLAQNTVKQLPKLYKCNILIIPDKTRWLSFHELMNRRGPVSTLDWGISEWLPRRSSLTNRGCGSYRPWAVRNICPDELVCRVRGSVSRVVTGSLLEGQRSSSSQYPTLL